MPHELFETVAAPTAHVSARSPVTVAVSIVAHILLIAIVVIAPLLAIDVLPTPYERIDRVLLAEAVPPPPLVRVADAPVAPRVTTPSPPAMRVPVSPADGIHEEGPALAPVPTIGTAGDMDAGVANGVFTGASYTASLPALPARAAPTGPVRAGRRIMTVSVRFTLQ